MGGAGTSTTGRVFTIPPSAPFLDALARTVLAGQLPRDGGPAPATAEIADTLIYLPNRAACRAMAGAFLRASPAGATLLPRLRPLGSAEEDALLLLAQDEDEDSPWRDLPFAAPVSALERRMVLTQFILAWARRVRQGGAGQGGVFVAETPAAAAELALDLMQLMDEAQSEGADLSRIPELLPERFAGHEQLSLDFLDIVVKAWPGYLASQTLLDPVERRNRIMALEAERLARERPETPVIVAGSTGSYPATAALMRAVLDLPRGAIVLPGADLHLDDAGWDALPEHPEHGQAGFHHLLETLGVARADVAAVPGTEPGGGHAARSAFLSEALRPAATLGRWPQYIAAASAEAVGEAFAGVSLIAAPTPQEEAAAIALILRDALEVPGRTAHLVTPDRTLARRVASELRRWDLDIGSGGEPLSASPAGTFFSLIAEAAATGAQIALLGILRHPLTRLGLNPDEVHRAASLLEIAGLRQPWCGDGLESLSRSLHLAQTVKPQHRSVGLFTEDDWALASDLLERLKEAMQPLTGLARAGAVPFATIAGAHAGTAAALMRAAAGGDETPGAEPSVAACADFMALLAGDVPGPELTLGEYPALFRSLIRLERASAAGQIHPRLQILTPTEARLARAEVVILAGLNEGTWPGTAEPGPWLNRAMRAELGLAPPERRIRLSAHDFWQGMAAPEVYLTRALKADGTPTVPSRWLMRIETLLSGMGLGGILEPKHPWLAWAAARNAAEPAPKLRAPAPRPPVAARPRSLSVSAVETLIANPYAIFARHILGLIPLEPLESEPDNDERGRLIHETLHLFARHHSEDLPPDAVGELVAIFDERARLFADRARVAAFWRPRMERFARWFAETEPERRKGAQVFSEVKGEFTFEAPSGPFTLTARADRIDLAPDGLLAIYDYKSGGIPSEKAVAAFKSPQLPLEALIAAEGHFRGLATRRVGKLAYISARGGEPAGEERLLTTPPAALAEGARQGLAALIGRFDLAETPYRAMRRAAFAERYKYDGYAHLARVAEWAGTGDGDGDGE